MELENKELLFEFLNMPIDGGDGIFDKFKVLPNAKHGEGKLPFQRYVYIPGTRKDRVVLVAHIDTVWDKNYVGEFELSSERKILFDNGVFTSANAEIGLGADDRAGCAMLWKLKDLGHSILIVDGEEHGKHGAKYLKSSNKSLYKELNKHCFMIELDHVSTNHVSFLQVHNTTKFKNYLCQSTGFLDRKIGGGCDLQILSKKICGANVGVGYYNQHRSSETLILEEWENTYKIVEELLKKEQRRFKTSKSKRLKSFAKRCVKKALRIFIRR